MAEGTGQGESLSIWFFVGIMTLAYGVVLLPYGAYEWFGGHEADTVLNNLHPTFWWGLLLFLFGALYVIRYRPGRPSADVSYEAPSDRPEIEYLPEPKLLEDPESRRRN